MGSNLSRQEACGQDGARGSQPHVLRIHWLKDFRCNLGLWAFTCLMATEIEGIHGNCQRPEWVRMLQALQQFWISSSITLRSCFVSIDACAKEHRWQRAVSLADEARRQNLETRVIQYNATMNACAKGGAWKQGVSFLAKAAETGLQLTSITFGTRASAFSKGNQW